MIYLSLKGGQFLRFRGGIVYSVLLLSFFFLLWEKLSAQFQMHFPSSIHEKVELRPSSREKLYIYI